MKPWMWLRIAAALQAFGTVGHTLATASSVGSSLFVAALLGVTAAAGYVRAFDQTRTEAAQQVD